MCDTLKSLCLNKLCEIVRSGVNIVPEGEHNICVYDAVYRVVVCYVKRYSHGVSSESSRRLLAYEVSKLHQDVLAMSLAYDKRRLCKLLGVSLSDKFIKKDEEDQLCELVQKMNIRGAFYRSLSERQHTFLFSDIRDKHVVSTECDTYLVASGAYTPKELSYKKAGLIVCDYLNQWMFPHHEEIVRQYIDLSPKDSLWNELVSQGLIDLEEYNILKNEPSTPALEKRVIYVEPTPEQIENIERVRMEEKRLAEQRKKQRQIEMKKAEKASKKNKCLTRTIKAR